VLLFAERLTLGKSIIRQVFFLPSAALGKVLIRRVPDEMLSAKHLTLGKDLFSGSE
jgi:hypothetical protein